MGKILEFPVLKPGTMATLLTSAGLYSGTIASFSDGIYEMENVKFYPYVNPIPAFAFPRLYLKAEEVLGLSDSIASLEQ